MKHWAYYRVKLIDMSPYYDSIIDQKCLKHKVQIPNKLTKKIYESGFLYFEKITKSLIIINFRIFLTFIIYLKWYFFLFPVFHKFDFFFYFLFFYFFLIIILRTIIFSPFFITCIIFKKCRNNFLFQKMLPFFFGLENYCQYNTKPKTNVK